MASLLQPTSTSCSFSHSTLFIFSSPPSSTFTTFKPYHPTPLFSTTKASPFHQTPTQLPRRKLFCKPLFAKYIREDYLVKKVSAKEVEELVKGERDVPLVVDFYATWCGPCTIMAQELEMLAVEYENNALIVKVDTDDEYEFARDMQVRGLPTLYFISPDPSKEAIRTEGLIPIQMMRDIINEL